MLRKVYAYIERPDTGAIQRVEVSGVTMEWIKEKKVNDLKFKWELPKRTCKKCSFPIDDLPSWCHTCSFCYYS